MFRKNIKYHEHNAGSVEPTGLVLKVLSCVPVYRNRYPTPSDAACAFA